MVEPWLRGTLGEVDAVKRQVLHALEQAREDVERWCRGLTDEQMNARPLGLAPVAFHLRHIGRSLDRLLTYAENRMLSTRQINNLNGEMEFGLVLDVMNEFFAGMVTASDRVKAIDPGSYEAARGVGRAGLPSTVGGLMVHCAEHTQRHVGQAIVTAKVVAGSSGAALGGFEVGGG
jgi:hypothetical protein